MTETSELVARVREVCDPQSFRARLDSGATFASESEIGDIRALCARLTEAERERDRWTKMYGAAVESGVEIATQLATVEAERDRLRAKYEPTVTAKLANFTGHQARITEAP